MVARHAGVGTGTVSRVLNDATGVTAETRQRVRAAIAELDYQPSQVARNLSLGTTSSVAAVAPFFTHPSAVERLRGLVRVLTARGYDVALHAVERPEQRDERLRSLAAPGRADGVVVVSLPPTDDEVARYGASGVPIILLDAHHPAATSIVIDNRAGGRLATRHLLDLGHRRIAFIGDAANPYGSTASVDRRAGYSTALKEAGVALDPRLVREGAHGRSVAAGLAEELLVAGSAAPTAIFVASDAQALGVLEAARRTGRRVPEDLSVIGFDDIEISRDVGLTTVRQPLEPSGARAAERLLAAIAGSDAGPVVETLPVELAIRDTTARPAPT